MGGVCLHPRGVLVESVRSCSFDGVVCVSVKRFEVKLEIVHFTCIFYRVLLMVTTDMVQITKFNFHSYRLNFILTLYNDDIDFIYNDSMRYFVTSKQQAVALDWEERYFSIFTQLLHVIHSHVHPSHLLYESEHMFAVNATSLSMHDFGVHTQSAAVLLLQMRADDLSAVTLARDVQSLAVGVFRYSFEGQ